MKSPRTIAGLAVLSMVVLAGCSSSGPATSTSTPSYQHSGPNAVGVTTLDLGSAGPVFGERLATVYYPAAAATFASHPKFSYTEASTLPTAFQAVVPPQYNPMTTVDAYTDAPGSTNGPYPVVLFSHGAAVSGSTTRTC